MRTFAGMKLNSLKDLKLVKGKLAEESRPTAAGQSSAPATNQPRNRTVVHPSRAEERARNEGLSKGQKVRLMDSSDTGTITGFGDGYYEIDLDGMVIRAVRSEFVPVDPDEDRQLYTSIPSRVHKPARRGVHEDAGGEITIDLHLERIPGSEGIPKWAALDYQMSYFRQTLRNNLRHKGRRIVYVHGVGDGTLATALRKELDETFALSTSWLPGIPGTTKVTIR